MRSYYAEHYTEHFRRWRLVIESFKDLSGKIGILGGTFDPVHNGHLAMARKVKDQLKLALVVFIPVARNPLKKDQPLASDNDRLEMLKLAVHSDSSLAVSDIELKRLPPSYTVDTLKLIHDQSDRKCNLHLIIGSDQLKRLHLWKDYHELFKLASIAVLTRKGSIAPDRSQFSESELTALKSGVIEFENGASSTAIRKGILENRSHEIGGMVPQEVAEYLQRTKLYGGARCY